MNIQRLLFIIISIELFCILFLFFKEREEKNQYENELFEMKENYFALKKELDYKMINSTYSSFGGYLGCNSTDCWITDYTFKNSGQQMTELMSLFLRTDAMLCSSVKYRYTLISNYWIGVKCEGGYFTLNRFDSSWIWETFWNVCKLPNEITG